ncbi:MAG: TonB-dependent receptor [Prevotella sp.]|nr:TonB-dependent receptor [Prevotella sp.]
MKRVFLILTLLTAVIGTHAQDIQLTGTVVDEQKVPLVGVTVAIKDQPGIGAITNIDGVFTMKTPAHATLIFSYIGFEKQQIDLKGRTSLLVVMEESRETVIDEVTVTGLGNRKKITVTGAVTTVDPSVLKTPTASLANALAGNVPGIMAMQTTGKPGDNVSEFWIRGISTFGAGSSALVLVDGFERDLNEVNVEDIQSFSVLKDASATAIYGSRGANGVVLITTKRGAEGQVRINAKGEYSYSFRTMTPELIDGVTYARMKNEALTTRNQERAYSDDMLALIGNGLDPDLFSNTNWMDLILNDGAPTYRANFDVSGGGSLARYYLSGSYVEEGGIYKVDREQKKDYNTNADYHRWNYRMNVDVNITKTTLLSLGVSGSLDKKNSPGGWNEHIWSSVMGQDPISIPIVYSNGYIPATGVANRQNPWALITQYGYEEYWRNRIQTTVNLKQDLDFITPGLVFYGRFGFDNSSTNSNDHNKQPETWMAQRLRDSEGNLVFTKMTNEVLMWIESHSYGERKETLEAELHWDRTFARNHKVGAVLKYSVDKTVNTSENTSNTYIQNIDRRHQGLAGQLTYGYKMRYFADFNFGYNGSENFAKGHQFGFFPAASAAWNIAEEPWVQAHAPWMDMLKVRYSYGKVGNDYMTVRFPYQPSFKTSAAYGYDYRDFVTGNEAVDPRAIGSSGGLYDGLTYAVAASKDVTWEVAKKHDLGVDFALLGNKVSGTVDLFSERRDGIYMTRNYLPAIIGLTNLNSQPAANFGSVSSQGFDGNVAFNEKMGKVDVTLRANMTYSKNKIEAYDEEMSRYPYRMYRGFRVNQARGLIAEGLFTSYDEIRDSPLQTFGDYAPGDIKYKDVNGDGLIDDNDVVPIGATTKPNLIYGFGVSALWKGFDVNVHFQGAGKSTFFINGYGVRPFSGSDWGNILTDVVGNYWSLGVNEDPDARYPRLTYGNNSNNYRNSTFWLRDGSYLRLKTLEIGYTLPRKMLSKAHITNLRVYGMATNLLTFSSFNLWDPEIGSSTGQEYPLSRVFTLGFTVGL